MRGKQQASTVHRHFFAVGVSTDVIGYFQIANGFSQVVDFYIILSTGGEYHDDGGPTGTMHESCGRKKIGRVCVESGNPSSLVATVDDPC